MTTQHWTDRAKARMKALKETQESVATKLGITQGALGHFLNRRKPTPPKRIEQLAQLLNVDPIWLQYGKNPPVTKHRATQYIPKTIGERAVYARKQCGLTPTQLAQRLGVDKALIEKAEHNEVIFEDIDAVAASLNVSTNWLLYGQEISDTSVSEDDVHQVIHAPPLQWVPLIDWAHAGNWRQAMLELPENSQWFPVTGNVNPNCFALRVEGDAMVNPGAAGPSFLPGTLIIINPDRAHQPGDYVLARQIKTNEACFKQYVRDGGVDYLRSLNPVYKLIQLKPDYAICGVMMAHLSLY